MSWSLYENKNGDNVYLEPLVFSNNKTQEDVVNEVIQAINDGHKVIFIKGVCGSGKSAIALNLAKQLGKTSIVVPLKTLQKQYEDDYTNKKYLLKENEQKLKIKIITGRQNFQCQYMQENMQEFDLNYDLNHEKNEKNLTLDNFTENQEAQESNQETNENISKMQKNKRKNDFSCDNPFLPCKIEIKEKNIEQIKKYIRKNPRIKINQLFLYDIKRMSIAPICQYWCPIVPSEIKLNILKDCEILSYTGLRNIIFNIYQRKLGCGYYDQYEAYINSDVIIFNSQKYDIETAMNRKPSTAIEIIDECDKFLDDLSNQEKININRFNFFLGSLTTDDSETQRIIDNLIDLTSEILKDKEIETLTSDENSDEKILNLMDTKIKDILKCFLNFNFMNYVECDEENYCYHVEEVAKKFEGFFKETYLTFNKEEKNLIVKLVTTNLEKRFKNFLDKNKIFVMMSGTIHSEKVLKEIFGLQDFKIIEAETKMPGSISKLKTGLEIDCKHKNFQKGKVTREQYLFALQKCIQQAEKPVLIHVNAFSDLPSEKEVEKYNLNIITRERLIELQEKDKTGKVIKKFKEGKIKILYTTKCSRGADFPGKICNSIILTKYPYPNISSLFWRILKKTRPEHYNSFYMDKAKREFWQSIYRGLRFKEDHIFLLSPDIRVLNRI